MQNKITSVGITERGDAGLDFSWENKLFPANIIISKSLAGNDMLIDKLVKHKDKIIFHCTCTGMGGTEIEPNVPEYEKTIKSVVELINRGFPRNQIVIRIDPIMPSGRGLSFVEKVMNGFKDTGVKRIRFSFMDLYPNVKERFEGLGIKLPYRSFTAPRYLQLDTIAFMERCNAGLDSIYDLESCGECTKYATGCISDKDLEILGIDGKIVVSKNKYPSRKHCLCGCKVELLKERKRCANQCLYCYWDD